MKKIFMLMSSVFLAYHRYCRGVCHLLCYCQQRTEHSKASSDVGWWLRHHALYDYRIAQVL